MLATLLTQYNPDGSVIPLSELSTARDGYGRRPFVFVEIDMDFCANVYGVAPCTATIDADNPQKCYNTLISCQDRPNFARSVKTYRFSDQNQQVPEGLDAIPCLQGISLTPAKIDTGNGLGLRAGASATFIDFPHSDIRIDPYVNERDYIPLANGTFWGKFRARNPYYNGRVMRIYSGYLDAAGKYNPDLFERRTYFIESFDGVSARGTVAIGAKDILKLAGDDRAVFPRPSVGKLTLDINDTQTAVTITPVGVGNLDYPASGFVRIGSEVCSFTRSGDNLTLVRGQGGTERRAHSVGDTVQLCGRFNGATVQNIVFELLTVGANINPDYIDIGEWNAEQAAYLPRLYSALITAPTGVSKLIAELAEQVGFFMFWDEVAEKIIFKAIRPNSGTDTIYDITADTHILADSLDIKDLVNERLNEVWVYYGIIDATKNLTEESNYKVVEVSSNPADQSEIQSNDLRIKKIFSRWISGRNGAAAVELANRYLLRYGQAPRQVALKLDAKDAQIALADFVRVDSPQNQTFSGFNQSLLLQIIQRVESKQGTTYDVMAREFAYDDVNFDTGLRELLVNEDAFDYNIREEYDTFYGDSPDGKIVRVIIAEGVLVTATSVSIPAMTFGAWPASTTLEIVIDGIVAGRGGDGGGTGGTGGVPFEGTGQDGGLAIAATRPAVITVATGGTLCGGGGGGGGVRLRTSGGQTYAVMGGGGGAPYAPAGFFDAVLGEEIQLPQAAGRLVGGSGASIWEFSDARVRSGSGGNVGFSGNVGALVSGSSLSVRTFWPAGQVGSAITGASLVTIVNNGSIRGGIIN
jgi:hypothetical protein